MSWLSYNGVMFVGVTGITFVDYFVLRKEHIDPAHLFAVKGGKYAFWGGVNWAAVIVTVLSTWGYLWLYNPVTMAMAGPFRYLGASIPTTVFSGIAYYLAAKWVLIPLRKGSYLDSPSALTKATLSSNPDTDAVTVSL